MPNDTDAREVAAELMSATIAALASPYESDDIDLEAGTAMIAKALAAARSDERAKTLRELMDKHAGNIAVCGPVSDMLASDEQETQDGK